MTTIKLSQLSEDFVYCAPLIHIFLLDKGFETPQNLLKLNLSFLAIRNETLVLKLTFDISSAIHYFIKIAPKKTKLYVGSVGDVSRNSPLKLLLRGITVSTSASTILMEWGRADVEPWMLAASAGESRSKTKTRFSFSTDFGLSSDTPKNIPGELSPLALSSESEMDSNLSFLKIKKVQFHFKKVQFHFKFQFRNREQ